MQEPLEDDDGFELTQRLTLERHLGAKGWARGDKEGEERGAAEGGGAGLGDGAAGEVVAGS